MLKMVLAKRARYHSADDSFLVEHPKERPLFHCFPPAALQHWQCAFAIGRHRWPPPNLLNSIPNWPLRTAMLAWPLPCSSSSGQPGVEWSGVERPGRRLLRARRRWPAELLGVSAIGHLHSSTVRGEKRKFPPLSRLRWAAL